MTERLKITIVVTAYNYGRYVERALNSALNARFPRKQFEVIVVDDGSTDDTPVILKKYDDEVRIIHQRNGGLAAACNAGIRAATGEYLIRLDADDELHPDLLSRCSEILDNDPAIGLVCTDRLLIDGGADRREVVIVDPGNIYGLIAPGIMFRRKILLDIGLYNSLYWEEHDLLIRYLRHHRATRVGEPLYLYYIHGQNMTQSAERRMRGWNELIAKWGIDELRRWGQYEELERAYRQSQSNVDAGKGVIFAAAKDAGGCNAILPVLRLLVQEGFTVHIFADGPAHPYLMREGFNPTAVSYDDGIGAVEAAFDRINPDLVFTGNSWGPSIENLVIDVARQRSIKSVGVLDSWLLYDKKFGDNSDPWRHLPDELVVMDEFAKREMVDLGAPARRLIVLGQPQLDLLLEKKQRFDGHQRQKTRELAGAGGDDVVIVFLSQAMAEFYGDDRHGTGSIGYTEFTAFEAVQAAVSRIRDESKRPVRLVVKLHPRETKDKYRNSGVAVVTDVDPHALILSADLTVGMDTILLVEACLMGCLNLSFQPGLSKKDNLLTNRLSIGEFCYDPDELEERMRKLLFNHQYQKNVQDRMRQLRMDHGATRRVFDHVVGALQRSAC